MKTNQFKSVCCPRTRKPEKKERNSEFNGKKWSNCKVSSNDRAVNKLERANGLILWSFSHSIPLPEYKRFGHLMRCTSEILIVATLT